MKYTLSALAALAILSTAASAETRTYPCSNLSATWQHAPQQQCGRILGNGSQPKVQNHGIPGHPTPPTVEIDDEPIIG